MCNDPSMIFILSFHSERTRNTALQIVWEDDLIIRERNNAATHSAVIIRSTVSEEVKAIFYEHSKAGHTTEIK